MTKSIQRLLLPFLLPFSQHVTAWASDGGAVLADETYPIGFWRRVVHDIHGIHLPGQP
ncbi:MAG TPA: hypothetical protein VMN36_08305 [Verrucomicrobiales bacterium]|nr:hypothetical protein [Verrucomicrobiales bacterium]